MEGSIDQLNYEIILEDKGFETKLKELEKTAISFNTNMTEALTISKIKDSAKDMKDFKKAVEKAAEAQKDLNDKMKAMPASKVRAFTDDVQRANKHLINTSSLMRNITQLTGVYFGAMGVRRFLSSLIEVTGQFEVQRMALRSMLQDADKADRIFGQFRQLALQSPYTFQEFAKFGKQLTAFNIPAENLVDTTKMLADVAAGLGVDMQRIILAYGQIKSAGVLKGTELRQLTEAGVPILDQLAKQIEETTGKTVQLAEVFDMIRKKQISFEMVEQAFREMTAEGGKFYNMQEVLVETLQGRIGKLKDVWQQALYDIGTSQGGLLKGSVDMLTQMVAAFGKMGNHLGELILAFGAYKAAAFAATLATRGYTAAQIASRAATLAAATATRVMNAALSVVNPYVALGAAVIACVGGLIKYATATNEAIDKTKILNDVTTDYKASLEAELTELHILLERMGKVNPATQTYAELKERLLDKYGSYLSAVDKENIAVGKLAGVYNTLAFAIEKTAMARARSNAEERLNTELTQTIEEITKTFQSTYKGLPTETRGNLLDFIFGRIDESGLVEDAQKYVEIFAYTSGNLIYELKNKYRQAVQAVEEGQRAIDEAFSGGSTVVGDGGEWPPKPSEWQMKVSKWMKGDLWKQYGYKPEEDWDTYYDRIEKAYQKASNDLLHATNETDKKLYSERKRAIESLNKDLGGALLASSSVFNKSVKAAEREQDKAEADAEAQRKRDIASVKKEIEVLRKYKDAYDNFYELLGEEGAKKVINQFFEPVTDFDFTTQIEEAIEKLRKLGDEEGAESLLASLGLGDANKLRKKLQEVQRVGEQFRNLIEDWTAKDMDADDDTFMGKMVKIVSDLKTKSNELFNKYQTGMRLVRQLDVNDPNQKQAVINYLIDNGMAEEQATEFWDTFVEKGEAALTQLYVDNLAKLRINAQKSVNELVDDYVKKQTKDFGLDDSDKSFSALFKTWKKFRDLAKEVIPDEEMKKAIEGTTLTLDEFVKMVEEKYAELGKDAKGKLMGVLLKMGRAVAQAFSEMSKSLAEYAKTAEGSIQVLTEGMSEFAGVVSSVARGASSGGLWGALAAGAGSVISLVVDGMTKTAQLEQKLIEAQEEARVLRYEMNLSDGISSIFGTDDWKKVGNAIENLQKLADAMKALRESEAADFLNGMGYIGMWLSGKVSEPFQQGGNYYIENLANTLGILDKLYDQYGNMNEDVLETILKGASLTESERNYITEALNNVKEYNKALEQVQAVMESVFGSIASSAADSIVDGWIEAKNAALDYSDILDDVAQSYSKMLVKSMVLDVLKDDESLKKITDAFVNNDTEKAMALIEGKMQEVAALEPAIQQVLQAFDPYFKRDDTERQGLSKGIESNFSQDTIDYWSGQLTLLVEYAHRGDEQRIAMNEILVNIRDAMAGTEDGSYAANVQTYLATIQSDTSSIRADISSMRSTLQNMNDHGVRML